MTYCGRIRGMADTRNSYRRGSGGVDHGRSAICDRCASVEAERIRNHLTLQIIVLRNIFSELGIRVKVAVGVILDSHLGENVLKLELRKMKFPGIFLGHHRS